LLSNPSGERLRVALSFDDGYLDHYKMAQLLYKRRITATFFLNTGLSHWNNKPLLTLRPKLIRRMRRMNHEIASRTQSHPNLQRLTQEQVRHELRGSKEYLQSLLDEQVEGFAYPYGKYDERIDAQYGWHAIH
jgi:peptidoglycan/xylan/chitin deacetylase (PgdA/CDA1 family)